MRFRFGGSSLLSLGSGNKAAGPHPLSKNNSCLYHSRLKRKRRDKGIYNFSNDQTKEHIFFNLLLTLTLTVIFSEGSKRVRREVIFIYNYI